MTQTKNIPYPTKNMVKIKHECYILIILKYTNKYSKKLQNETNQSQIKINNN